MKVLKFGGSSMGTEESLQKVTEIISNEFKQGRKFAVTCSAMGNITDELITIAHLAKKSEVEAALRMFSKIKKLHFDTAEKFKVAETFYISIKPIFKDLGNLIRGISLIRELSSQSEASLISFGEKFSARLLAEILKTQAIPAVQFDSDFIRTKGVSYAEDQVDWEKCEKNIQKNILTAIENYQIPIVTGFYGRNHRQETTLLGRGGTDLTGAILTKCINGKKLEIWSDVDGLMSADPRIVPNAEIIPEIGFVEASELCFFGAKVLHPKTIRPVIESGGTVWIKNTFNPQAEGTRIIKKSTTSTKLIQSIASKKTTIITVDIYSSSITKCELFAQIFTLAAQNKIRIDAMASSESVISICISNPTISRIFERELKKISTIEIKKDRKIICVVSPPTVLGKAGVATKFLSAVSDANVSIEMYSQNASELAQLVVIKEEDTEKAVKSIHKKLIEDS